MPQFPISGPLFVGGPSYHLICNVSVEPESDEDKSNVELVKACGAMEQEILRIVQVTLYMNDQLHRIMDGEQTDTIIKEEPN